VLQYSRQARAVSVPVPGTALFSASGVGDAARWADIHALGRILILALGTGVRIDDDAALFDADGLGGAYGDAIVAARTVFGIDAHCHDLAPMFVDHRRNRGDKPSYASSVPWQKILSKSLIKK
jgi:hypothetical protein